MTLLSQLSITVSSLMMQLTARWFFSIQCLQQADLPLLPISTLAALAQRHYREAGARRILAAFDARMGELYWGAYRLDESGLVRLVGEEQVAAPDALRLPPGDGWHGVGSGWGTYAEALKQKCNH